MPWLPISEPSKEEESAFVRSAKKKTRFLVDENLGPGVAELLREAGWNAKYVGEVGLEGHDDSDVFAFAFRESRILLTHDADYLDDRRFPPHRNPGVVVLPGASGEDRELLRALGAMLSVVGPFRDVWSDAKIRISPVGDWTVNSRDPIHGANRVTRYRFPKHGMPLEWHDSHG